MQELQGHVVQVRVQFKVLNEFEDGRDETREEDAAVVVLAVSARVDEEL